MDATSERVSPPRSLLARSPGVGSIASAIAESWRTIAWSAAALIGVLFFAAALLHFTESHLRPENYGSLGAALAWVGANFFTVGYGDVPPVTTFGRFVAGASIVLGILVLAAPVIAITGNLRKRADRHDFVVSFGMVSSVPLFKCLDAAAIAGLVGVLTAHRVSAGTCVVRKGDSADGMYFIASGEVEVELPRGRTRLGPGEFFGEIALLMPNPKRTASVTTVTACDLLKLSSREFERLLGAQDEFTEQLGAVARKRLSELLAETETA